MPQEIVLFKGLPGSGKTTLAKALQAKAVRKYKRINRDELRSMFDDSKFHRKNEKFILEFRRLAIQGALGKGYSVILDDTNLNPKYERDAREIAEEHGAEVSIVDLTEISVNECISRDLKRPNSVGSKVIRKMYNQYLAGTDQEAPRKERREGYPLAIICDIDGTLAQHHRSPYDYDSLMTDTIIEPVHMALVRLTESHPGEPWIHCILLSGRGEEYREPTEQWLKENDVQYDELYMRPAKDSREDSIVKEELYRKHVEPVYDVLWVLDDRDRVVQMWRRIGLTCLQVNEGDF